MQYKVTNLNVGTSLSIFRNEKDIDVLLEKELLIHSSKGLKLVGFSQKDTVYRFVWKVTE